MSTEFSIVTIVKHRTQQLSNLISSIERSSRLPQEMVIVWMTSPSDESLLTSDKFTIHHRFTTNDELPIAKALNRGFQTCTTEQLFYLDVDCICPKAILDNLVSSLTEGRVVTTNVSQLKCKVEDIDEQVIQQLSTAPVTTAKKCPFIQFNSAVFGITRQDFKRIGGFDPDYHGYGIGDLDFAMRCSQAGLQLLNTGYHIYKQFHLHFEPPVNHLCDLVANAELFKQKWNCYPFCDWFDKFAALGLVNEDYEHSGMRVTRLISEEELGQFMIRQPIDDQPMKATALQQTA